MERMLAEHPDRVRARGHALVRDGDIPEGVLREAEGRLASVLDRMEAALAGGPWLVGDAPSLADFTWLPFLDRMMILGMGDLLAPSARPRVADWHERIRARPSHGRAVLGYLAFPGGRS
jgi:glutathione S-transferase